MLPAVIKYSLTAPFFFKKKKKKKQLRVGRRECKSTEEKLSSVESGRSSETSVVLLKKDGLASH